MTVHHPGTGSNLERPNAGHTLRGAARAELTPHGVLRVALNHANFLLVTAPAPDAVGVAPDLGRELGRRLDVPVRFVGYDHAGHVADAASHDEWDVAFIGADPVRAGEVHFTPPYVQIEATYLVGAGSLLTSVDSVDAPGVRIAVAARSAYHLQLQRIISHATLMEAPGLPESEIVFQRDELDVLAGLRPHLLRVQRDIPGSRVLEGSFMSVQQAMGVPRGRPAAALALEAFAADVLTSGQVAALISAHGVEGVTLPHQR